MRRRQVRRGRGDLAESDRKVQLNVDKPKPCQLHISAVAAPTGVENPRLPCPGAFLEA